MQFPGYLCSDKFKSYSIQTKLKETWRFCLFRYFRNEKERTGSEKHDRKASAIARLANVILSKNKARKIVLAFSLGGKHALKIGIRQVQVILNPNKTQRNVAFLSFSVFS